MDALKQFVATANARADADRFKSLAKAMAEHFDAERDRLRGALKEIADMKPSELAAETMPGLVHGPALLLGNCQRIARQALKK
jgi:hypothetical protein